jgi:hypothetical protein
MSLPDTAPTSTEPAVLLDREPPVIELWDAWAFAEIDAEFALKRWWDACDGERAAAFAAYLAALDREMQAAAVLEAHMKPASGLSGSWV